MNTLSQKENTLSTTKFRQSEKTLLGTNSPNFTIKHSIAHVNAVKAVIDSTQGQLDTHRSKIEECRALIGQLRDSSEHSNEELLETLRQNFEKIYNNFTVQVTLQKQENEKMQQKIDKLKKEKTEIQQTILAGAQKCAELENELGKYPI